MRQNEAPCIATRGVLPTISASHQVVNTAELVEAQRP